MTFKITYNSPRQGVRTRTVTDAHFAGSKAFFPVLKLEVGETTPPGRYVSAGYKSIERVA